jgi:hypothetical protein
MQELVNANTHDIVGAALAPSGFISTIAGTASAINIRANGREIS